MSFTSPASASPRPLFPGVTGRYAHGVRLTVGEVELAAGANVPEHQHPHEQVTYVLSGEIEVTLGGETRVLAAGGCALIPPHAAHRVRAVTPARVLDIFTPAREDFR